MSQTIRPTPRFSPVTFVFAALSLAAFAQPIPKATPSSGPGGVGPTNIPAGMNTPMLPGISADELQRYSTFQQQANENPAIKDINAKIAKLSQEIQQLRAEANAIRGKLTAANPEMKKIQDKITSAMQSQTGTGPMPLPAPTPNKTNSGPMPQPAPTSSKAK